VYGFGAGVQKVVADETAEAVSSPREAVTWAVGGVGLGRDETQASWREISNSWDEFNVSSGDTKKSRDEINVSSRET